MTSFFVADNDPVTDSFMVAKAFGKRPDNVIRDIEKTIKACPEEFDTKLNFEVCYKNNELQNGKPQKFYRLRKDGLMLLVMSYTKKEAMRIKIAYINAFNWMYAMLQVGRRQFEEERNAVMLEFLKEKDVASMSGRLLRRWGKRRSHSYFHALSNWTSKVSWHCPVFLVRLPNHENHNSWFLNGPLRWAFYCQITHSGNKNGS